MTPFFNAAELLFSGLYCQFGTLVDYTRIRPDGQRHTLAGIRAVPVQPAAPLEKTENQLTASVDLEFIIRSSSLQCDGERWEPKPGDRIVVLFNDSEYEAVYKNGKNCFRYCSPEQTLIRVFTKKVGCRK